MSQRPLSPESAIKEPFEVSMPTTSGFNSVFSNNNNHLLDNRINEPNISISGSFHTSQINPCFSPNSDLATTTQNSILLTALDSNKVQTMLKKNK